MDSSKPVILLTGASKGLGLQIAKIILKGQSSSSSECHLAIPACNLITISRSITDELKQLQSESNGACQLVQGSVNDEQVNKKAVELAIEKWARLDSIILNAGVVDFARIADVTPASFSDQISTNLTSLITTLHYTIPHLRKSPTGIGRVVLVSSGAAVGNYSGWAAYNASKAGLNSIARTLANEEEKLAVWAVRPGVLDTDMQLHIRNSGLESMGEASHSKFTTLYKENKLIKPELPAHVLVSLALNGTRDNPKAKGQEGKGSGELGAFVDWGDEELKAFRRQD